MRSDEVGYLGRLLDRADKVEVVTDDESGSELGEHGVHDAYLREQDPYVLHIALVVGGGALVAQSTAPSEDPVRHSGGGGGGNIHKGGKDVLSRRRDYLVYNSQDLCTGHIELFTYTALPYVYFTCTSRKPWRCP